MSNEIGSTTDIAELQRCQGWFRVLLEREFGKQSGIADSGLRYEVDLGDSAKFAIIFDEQTTRLTLDCPKHLAARAREIGQEALSKARSRVSGPLESWRIGFTSTAHLGDEAARHHMFRSLSQHKRFAGHWRLGPETLLSFKQSAPEAPPLFANQEVTATFRTPGPSRSTFNPSAEVRRQATLIRALVCLATASRLDAPGQLMRAKPQFEEELLSQLTPSTPELPAFYDLDERRVELWPLVGGPETETLRRLGGAVFAYDHALSQKTPAASTMFFVASLEALSVPNADWKTDRVSKRFVEFLSTLCPDVLADTMAHRNFEQVFGKISSHQKFATYIYNLRSQSIHAGSLGEIVDPFAVDIQSSMKTSLIGRIAHDAILRFAEQPFSPLCGHPGIYPSLRVDVSQDERIRLIRRAKDENCTIAQLVRKTLGL